MENLGVEEVQSEVPTTKEEYNNIPVVYCKQCLSISIRVSDEIDYCADCGSTDMEEVHIDEWNRMYEQRYNKNFLISNKWKKQL